MKKILIFLLVLCFYAFPAYGAEKFESVEPDKECQLAAGKIWVKYCGYNYFEVDVKNNIIFVRSHFTEENKKAITELAPNCEIVFLGRAFNGDSTYQMYNYSFTAGEKYAASRGMLFEMENAPYMQDGKLMIPLRDFYNLYLDVTKMGMKLEWLGDAEQNIKIDVASKGGGTLSVIKNTISKYEEPDIPINGKIEMKDGVVFVPLDLENAKTIFGFQFSHNTWDAETNTLTLCL